VANLEGMIDYFGRDEWLSLKAWVAKLGGMWLSWKGWVAFS
jgi:hypothetical protein